jgi:hypothetical protein
MPALERAQYVKEARRAFLREVKAGRISLVEVLRGEIPDYLRNCSMHKLIRSYRSFPEKRYRRIMDEAGAGYSKTLAEMTDRQVSVVARHLEEWETAHPVRQEATA